MAKEILTMCGFRCDLCLGYRENYEKEDRRCELSEGWHKYFGFKFPVEKIKCEGCLCKDKEELLDKDCSIRPCVIEKGLENCSQCENYPVIISTPVKSYLRTLIRINTFR